MQGLYKTADVNVLAQKEATQINMLVLRWVSASCSLMTHSERQVSAVRLDLPIRRSSVQAERLLKRCLEIQQRHSSEDDTLSIATTQTQLGGICIVQANPRAAETFLRGALEQIQGALGAKHPDTALSRCRLASCTADLNR